MICAFADDFFLKKTFDNFFFHNSKSYICRMKVLRFLLFPFGILYWIITSVRNFLYDKEFLKSYKTPIPVVAVGNLSTGGTGKSPQTEYLIRLLSDKYRVAVLSRGYKRKSKSFVLADNNTKVEELGDEPFQFFTKFKNVLVAVDTNRTNGIQQLLKLETPPEVILLDDAYQHRKVKATTYILLTAYSDLFCDDFILPIGNLREPKNGAQRADFVIVTKCPNNLSENQKETIRKKLSLKSPHQKLFFTRISYDEYVFSANSTLKTSEMKQQTKVLLAGIAKPESFFSFLENEGDILLKYPDHHDFSEAEIKIIKQRANGKPIITTEKDYARIKDKFDNNQLFYLPIKTEFVDGKKEFDCLIFEIVNSKL